VDDQLDAVLKVKALEAEANAIRDRLAAAATTIRESRDKIASFEADLSAKKTQTTALREAQVAETARQADLLAAVRAKKQSYLDRLRALERESDGIALALRTAQAGQSPVFDLPKVRTPLDKLAVDSPYGYRVHPIFGETRLHTGADLNAPMGTAIRAAAAGKVVMAESEDGYGNVLVIDHGNQVATAYAHMSSFGVKVGDVVARGQIIGKAGATGYATGPHLHFEYRVAGAPIDPMPLVDATEPVACAVLNASKDAVDAALVKTRPDCAPPPTTTITTTTTTRPLTGR
jgi:murein DD-endopeptidase MepM/ murein hydrolase activator NlpD